MERQDERSTDPTTVDEPKGALTCGFLFDTYGQSAPRRRSKFSRGILHKGGQTPRSIQQNTLIYNRFDGLGWIWSGAAGTSLSEPVSGRSHLRTFGTEDRPERVGVHVAASVVAIRATRPQIRQIVHRATLRQGRDVVDRRSRRTLAQPAQFAVLRQDNRPQASRDSIPVSTLRGQDRRLFRRRPGRCARCCPRRVDLRVVVVRNVDVPVPAARTTPNGVRRTASRCSAAPGRHTAITTTRYRQQSAEKTGTPR